MSNNINKDPNQWLPPSQKPDILCTILELWSRHHNEIAKYRNFQSTNTIADYTGMLFVISPALSTKPVSRMTAPDCWIAAKSVRTWKTKSGIRKNYSDNTLNKRLTVIRDIFLYAEDNGICINPLSYAPWDLIKKGKTPDFSLSTEDIRQKLEDLLDDKDYGVLTPSQERTLIKKILKNITNPDGRWVGLALYVYCGLRPSEGRDIRFGDSIPFDDCPSRRYIRVLGSATDDGTHQDRMKNKYSHRYIPEHIELNRILSKREKCIRDLTGNDDISKLPVICKKDNVRLPCTALELATFAKKVLRDIISEEALESAAMRLFLDSYSNESNNQNNDEDAVSANNCSSAYALRHLFCTRMYSHTQLSDDEIRLLMGHKTDTKIPDPYSPQSLYKMMLLMDHRLIHSGLTPKWKTVFGPESTEIDIVNAGRYQLIVPREITRQSGELLMELEAILP